MKEINGDLFEIAKGAVIAITTNGFVKGNGEAVMGAGCAKQAKTKWPELPAKLGRAIQTNGNQVMRLEVPGYQQLVTFPVKHKWFENADPALIEESAKQLRNMADRHGWTRLFVPRPGCGNGKLKWEDVRPKIEPHFDDRFIIVDYA